jgi:hypothetical protein
VSPWLSLALLAAAHPGRRRQLPSGGEQRSRHPEMAVCTVEVSDAASGIGCRVDSFDAYAVASAA